MPPLPEFLIWLAFAFVSILIAFTVHEFAHAWMAFQLGDPTAKYEGRLTLNPVVHLDPVGAIVLLSTMMASGGSLVIGWGKPVRFDSDNLKDPIGGGAGIALAGPCANFLLAALAGLPFHLGLVPAGLAATALLSLVRVNVALGLFNLIPFPPLDGWKIAQVFVPRPTAWSMKRFEARAGMGYLVAFMVFLYFLGGPLLRPPFQMLMVLFTGSPTGR